MPNWAPEMGMLLGHGQGWGVSASAIPRLGNTGEATKEAIGMESIVLLFF